jgi:hypothetical protein
MMVSLIQLPPGHADQKMPPRTRVQATFAFLRAALERNLFPFVGLRPFLNRVCDPDFNHISFCFDLSHKTCSINLSNPKSENPIKRMIPPDYENTCSVELRSPVRTAVEERKTHV